MFRRRLPLSSFERVRQYIWPRGGWSRALRYTWQRLLRINGSADSIALGLAAGAFISATPFLGLHIILAGLIAWVMGGNIIASAIGTWVGNPISFPFIWIASFRLGHAILGTDAEMGLLSELSVSMLMSDPLGLLVPLILPMTIGGAFVGVVMGAVVYYPSRSMIHMFQTQRRALRKRMKKDHNS